VTVCRFFGAVVLDSLVSPRVVIAGVYVYATKGKGGPLVAGAWAGRAGVGLAPIAIV